ncbi:MAG: hypothetical protein ACJ8M1_07915 [Chthoniobacterales bacterium]
MRVFRDVLFATSAFLLVVSIIDISLRAFVVSLIFGSAAYGIHRRFIAVWWLGLALLLWSASDSALDAFRGPRTHIAIMCSVLGVFVSALLLSVWFRQRSYFQSHATSKA